MSKSSTITDPDWLPNPTPGEILMEEFLRPLALSQSALARVLRVPPRRINEIVLWKALDHGRHRPPDRPLFRPDARLLLGTPGGSRSHGAPARDRRPGARGSTRRNPALSGAARVRTPAGRRG